MRSGAIPARTSPSLLARRSLSDHTGGPPPARHCHHGPETSSSRRRRCARLHPDRGRQTGSRRSSGTSRSRLRRHERRLVTAVPYTSTPPCRDDCQPGAVGAAPVARERRRDCTFAVTDERRAHGTRRRVHPSAVASALGLGRRCGRNHDRGVNRTGRRHWPGRLSPSKRTGSVGLVLLLCSRMPASCARRRRSAPHQSRMPAVVVCDELATSPQPIRRSCSEGPSRSASGFSNRPTVPGVTATQCRAARAE
jgi:hypothetical protein